MLKLACASSEVSKKSVLYSITAPDECNSRLLFGSRKRAELELSRSRCSSEPLSASDGRLESLLSRTKNLARWPGLSC